jgi:hypothetical protein
MAKRSKTSSSARLKRLQEISKKGTPFAPSVAQVDWNDQIAWSDAARNALNLDDNFDEAARFIRRAFEEFGLNSHDPYHWRRLLGFYVRAHVRPGKPVKWSSEDLCELLRHISAIRERNPHLKTKQQVYRALVKRAPYAGKKTDFLKYGHDQALDPRKNDILRSHRDAFIQISIGAIRLAYEEKGMTGVPPAIEQKIKDLALDHALGEIGAPKSRWE